MDMMHSREADVTRSLVLNFAVSLQKNIILITHAWIYKGSSNKGMVVLYNNTYYYQMHYYENASVFLAEL